MRQQQSFEELKSNGFRYWLPFQDESGIHTGFSPDEWKELLQLALKLNRLRVAEEAPWLKDSARYESISTMLRESIGAPYWAAVEKNYTVFEGYKFPREGIAGIALGNIERGIDSSSGSGREFSDFVRLIGYNYKRLSSEDKQSLLQGLRLAFEDYALAKEPVVVLQGLLSLSLALQPRANVQGAPTDQLLGVDEIIAKAKDIPDGDLANHTDIFEPDCFWLENSNRGLLYEIISAVSEQVDFATSCAFVRDLKDRNLWAHEFVSPVVTAQVSSHPANWFSILTDNAEDLAHLSPDTRQSIVCHVLTQISETHWMDSTNEAAMQAEEASIKQPVLDADPQKDAVVLGWLFDSTRDVFFRFNQSAQTHRLELVERGSRENPDKIIVSIPIPTPPDKTGRARLDKLLTFNPGA